MLDHVPPSLVAFLEISALAGAGLGLVLWGWHRARTARGAVVESRRPPALLTQEPETVPASNTAAAADDPSYFFATAPSVPAVTAPDRRLVGSGGQVPKPHAVPGRNKTRVIVLVGVLLVCLAGYQVYRNTTKDFGMPDELLGLPAAPQGSALGRDVEDMNTQLDRDGLEVKAQLYGNANGWVFVAVSTGDLVGGTTDQMYGNALQRSLGTGSALTRGVPITNWQEADPGPAGGSMSCGAVPTAQVAACGWIDQAAGEAGYVILVGPTAASYLENTQLARSAVTRGASH